MSLVLFFFATLFFLDIAQDRFMGHFFFLITYFLLCYETLIAYGAIPHRVIYIINKNELLFIESP